jgi:hypothetical protein
MKVTEKQIKIFVNSLVLFYIFFFGGIFILSFQELTDPALFGYLI